MAIIRVTLKDPDTMYDAVQEYVEEELKKSDLPEDEQEAVKELREEKYREACYVFFEYGEYLTIDIDTDKQTATVIPVRELNK